MVKVAKNQRSEWSKASEVTSGESRTVRTRTEQSTTEGQMANGQNDQEKLEQATEFEEALQCRYGAATGRGGESAASSHEGGQG